MNGVEVFMSLTSIKVNEMDLCNNWHEWHFNFRQVIRLIWRKPIEEIVALIMYVSAYSTI